MAPGFTQAAHLCSCLTWTSEPQPLRLASCPSNFLGHLAPTQTLDFTLCLSLFSYLGSFSLCPLKYLCVFESKTSADGSVFPMYQWSSPENLLVCSSSFPTRPMCSVPCAHCHALLRSPCRPCLSFFPFLLGSHAVWPLRGPFPCPAVCPPQDQGALSCAHTLSLS